MDSWSSLCRSLRVTRFTGRQRNSRSTSWTRSARMTAKRWTYGRVLEILLHKKSLASGNVSITVQFHEMKTLWCKLCNKNCLVTKVLMISSLFGWQCATHQQSLESIWWRDGSWQEWRGEESGDVPTFWHRQRLPCEPHRKSLFTPALWETAWICSCQSKLPSKSGEHDCARRRPSTRVWSRTAGGRLWWSSRTTAHVIRKSGIPWPEQHHQEQQKYPRRLGGITHAVFIVLDLENTCDMFLLVLSLSVKTSRIANGYLLVANESLLVPQLWSRSSPTKQNWTKCQRLAVLQRSESLQARRGHLRQTLK